MFGGSPSTKHAKRSDVRAVALGLSRVQSTGRISASMPAKHQQAHFVSLASQKNFIAFYHMGMYANTELYNWFITEYAKRCKYKIDMGKSCVRFKRMNDIPIDLIGELMTKLSVQDWISMYETAFVKKQ